MRRTSRLDSIGSGVLSLDASENAANNFLINHVARDGSGMNNFYRTLRMVFRYKWTLAASTFTAVMVALLWGFNITAAYPVLAVISNNKSLQDWVRDDIAQTQAKIDDLNAKIQQLQTEIKDKKDAQDGAQPPEKQLSLSDLRHLNSELASDSGSLKAEQSHLNHTRFFQPFVEKYLPADAYAALFVIMMVTSVGYIVKNVFLVFDGVLVDRLSNLATLDLRKKFYRRTSEDGYR